MHLEVSCMLCLAATHATGATRKSTVFAVSNFRYFLRAGTPRVSGFSRKYPSFCTTDCPVMSPSSSEFSSLAEGRNVVPVMMFLGGGNMARALIDGAVTSGFATKEEIAVSVRSEQSAQRWKNEGFTKVFTNNNEMLSLYGAGILYICVKPQIYERVVAEFKTDILQDCPIVVSIMAGVKISDIVEKLTDSGYSQPVIRLMPSMPCQVRASASIVTSQAGLTDQQLSLVTSLAKKVGTCTVVDEKAFDAAAAVASCGPAFIFVLIEAMADGGVLCGLPRADALALATQTVIGAAQLVQQSGLHPAVLKDQVCSAGGSTIAGVRALEKCGARSALIEAVKASTERAGEMGKKEPGK